MNNTTVLTQQGLLGELKSLSQEQQALINGLSNQEMDQLVSLKASLAGVESKAHQAVLCF